MPGSFWKEVSEMNKDYVRVSVVAEYIDGLLQEKRALGFSYVFEEYILNVFDNYCQEHGLDDPCFTRDFLIEWLAAWNDESSSYHSQRISFVRQLARYMNSLGVPAYIPVETVKKDIVVPYILSRDELCRFFKILDEETPKTTQSYAWRLRNEYRVIFRLLYCCGLRNSEVCNLKTEDVNLDEGIITIYHSKGDKDRLVYLPEDLCAVLVSYKEYLVNTLGYLPVWFFPSRYPGKHIHKTTLDHWFGIIWTKVTGGKKHNRKPTVHSLRHSYTVDRMNAWYAEGKSFEQMLPYLSKYLGHSSINESMYYYHLNEEANALIRSHDRSAKTVFPGVEKYET